MPENLTHTLQILLDPSGSTVEQLKQQVEKLLEANLSDIQLTLEATDAGYLLITLSGPIAVVDDCHNAIDKYIIEPAKRNSVLLVDEAGESVRQQAYPILARIEGRLRTFVNRALLEVYGFNWWNDLAPVELQEKVLQTRVRDPEYGSLLHPLEYTQFDDLIELITAEVSEWPESKPLSAADFQSLLSGCASIDQLNAKLEKKTKKISYWANVFAHYFRDIDEWKQFKSSFSFAIVQRHRVMHHRPMRLGTIQALLQLESQLQKLFESAKPKLSEQERVEVQIDISGLKESREYLIGMNQQMSQAFANAMRLPSISEQFAQSLPGLSQAIANAMRMPSISEQLAQANPGLSQAIANAMRMPSISEQFGQSVADVIRKSSVSEQVRQTLQSELPTVRTSKKRTNKRRATKSK